jgi:hypothetical protein
LNQQSKSALGALIAALALGCAGDALLRETPWGLNAALWTLLLAAAFWGVQAKRQRMKRNDVLFLAILVVLGALFAWRASVFLQFFQVLAIAITVTLLLWRFLSASGIRAAGIQGAAIQDSVAAYAFAALIAAVHTICGLPLLIFNDLRWAELRGKRPLSPWLAAARGLALAAPLLLIFGGLLMAGDMVFNKLVSNAIQIDFTRVFSHVFLAIFFAWMVAGILRVLALGKDEALLRPLQNSTVVAKHLAPRPVLDIVEGSVVLGLLDLLFLAFVIVQFKYLFGGASLVRVSPKLTYAEYARSGFFALFAVAALVLPLLLLADWFVKREDRVSKTVFNTLGAIQIGLLFVIMASAVERMRIYVREYGLTVDRLYPTAFMAWLAVVFIWFALTVFASRRERFAFGAYVAGLLLLITLNILDPDALIARTNASRARSSLKYDSLYNMSLGPSAVPYLIETLPLLGPRTVRDGQPLAAQGSIIARARLAVLEPVSLKSRRLD